MRHPASVDLRRHFPSFSAFDLPIGRRPASLLSSMPGSRACRLTYHMFQNYEPRTHRDRSAVLAFIHRSHNKMPFDFFSSSALALPRVLAHTQAFSLSSFFRLVSVLSHCSPFETALPITSHGFAYDERRPKDSLVKFPSS